jgi:hypothetical protein
MPTPAENALTALAKANVTNTPVQVSVAWSLIQIHLDLIEILNQMRADNPARFG